MTEDEALALAREATETALAIYADRRRAMTYLNQQCMKDRKLMEAFVMVGHSVVKSSRASS